MKEAPSTWCICSWLNTRLTPRYRRHRRWLSRIITGQLEATCRMHAINQMGVGSPDDSRQEKPEWRCGGRHGTLGFPPVSVSGLEGLQTLGLRFATLPLPSGCGILPGDHVELGVVHGDEPWVY